MQSTSENFIPILFMVLFGFVALNMLINFVLLYTCRHQMNKLLAVYWPTILAIYLIQGSFQQGQLGIALAYSATIVGALVTAVIGFEAIGRKFPWKKYLVIAIPFYPLTIWLNSLGFSFTKVAMPFAILSAAPLVHAFIFMNIVDRTKTTRLQKFLGIIYFMHAIHCINFALFRMDPGAQLWGWLVSFALCNALAIFLPSMTLELTAMNEKERLENLVTLRTDELNKSLKTNDSLFKVLIHDISNPLMVMKGYLFLFKDDRENKEFLLEKIQKSQAVIEGIITQIKNIHRLKSQSKQQLEAVAIEDCFNEISFMYEQTLKHKNITLNFNNQLPPKTYVLADQISLTHSVLSNLVSNGIKFNSPDSRIMITAKEENGNIILEVKDQGPGIPQEVIDDIMRNKELISTEGTMGEKGSGLGLSIAKSFVDSYGGQIEIDSSFMHANSMDRGTNIRITLDRA